MTGAKPAPTLERGESTGYAGPMIASCKRRGSDDPTEMGTGSNAGPHFDSREIGASYPEAGAG